MSETLVEPTEFDGAGPEPSSEPVGPQASYDPNDADSVQAYIAEKSQAAAEQHIAGWLGQVQHQQQQAEAIEKATQEWLGDPWSEGYEERLMQLEIDRGVVAQVTAFREQYAPVFAHLDRVQAEQAAQAQEAALSEATERSNEVLLDEAEQLGGFDPERAYQLAEQMTAATLGSLVADGVTPDQAMAFLREKNFAEAALRAGARMAAGNADVPNTERPSAPVQDELAIARRFVQQPRSPSEAIRQTNLERQAAASPALQRELGRMDARRVARIPQSEADVARNFIDRKRAEARP